MILNGELSPGDRLPGEHELSARFGVSRTVIREAIKALAEKGLVAVAPRRGMVVTRVRHENVAELVELFLQGNRTTLERVMEARAVIETAIAGLAAERRDARHIKQLESAVNVMESTLSPEQADDYLDADNRFHRTLAEAADNPVFMVMLQSMEPLLEQSRRITHDAPGAAVEAVRNHKAILEAVAERDVTRARAAMERHMQEVRAELQARAVKPQD